MTKTFKTNEVTQAVLAKMHGSDLYLWREVPVKPGQAEYRNEFDFPVYISFQTVGINSHNCFRMSPGSIVTFHQYSEQNLNVYRLKGEV